MIDIDWNYISEEFVRIGLIFGAIFQLVCIAAAIFLPYQSDSQQSSSDGKQSGRYSQTIDHRDSEDNEGLSDVEESTSYGINTNKTGRGMSQNLHQRHHSHQNHPNLRHEDRSSTSSNRSTNHRRQEKKKRR